MIPPWTIQMTVLSGLSGEFGILILITWENLSHLYVLADLGDLIGRIEIITLMIQLFVWFGKYLLYLLHAWLSLGDTKILLALKDTAVCWLRFRYPAFVPTADSDLRPYVKESQTAGLHSVNCLCMKVKCIHLFHWLAMGNVLNMCFGRKKRKSIFILLFASYDDRRLLILIRNSPLGKEGKQMVYLYIHNARSPHYFWRA